MNTHEEVWMRTYLEYIRRGHPLPNCSTGADYVLIAFKERFPEPSGEKTNNFGGSLTFTCGQCNEESNDACDEFYLEEGGHRVCRECHALHIELYRGTN